MSKIGSISAARAMEMRPIFELLRQYSEAILPYPCGALLYLPQTLSISFDSHKNCFAFFSLFETKIRNRLIKFLTRPRPLENQEETDG